MEIKKTFRSVYRDWFKVRNGFPIAEFTDVSPKTAATLEDQLCVDSSKFSGTTRQRIFFSAMGVNMDSPRDIVFLREAILKECDRRNEAAAAYFKGTEKK